MRQGLGLGHGHDRAGGAARCAARAPEKAAPAQRALGRGHGARAAREPASILSAPNPSVETLLHAFLPHAFVDHTHSTAVLSLTDQPEGEKLCEEVYGKRLGYVPYIMPGFALAKAAADAFERDRSVEGLILHKHGIFTFGADAREAYERMIEHVTLAEERLKRGRKTLAMAKLPAQIASRAEVAPIIRGACALKDEKIEGAWTRMILDFRASDAILNFVNGAELARYSQAGVVTPDHTIRTKNWPLIVPAPEAGKLDDFSRDVRAAVANFVGKYRTYFDTNNARAGGIKKSLDPLPRVVLVPGLGLFGLGRSRKDARVAADLAEAAIETIADAEAIGRFRRCPSPTCSTWNTGRWSRPSSAPRSRCRSPARSSRSRARAAGSAPRPRRRSPLRAPRSRCST